MFNFEPTVEDLSAELHVAEQQRDRLAARVAQLDRDNREDRVSIESRLDLIESRLSILESRADGHN